MSPCLFCKQKRIERVRLEFHVSGNSGAAAGAFHRRSIPTNHRLYTETGVKDDHFWNADNVFISLSLSRYFPLLLAVCSRRPVCALGYWLDTKHNSREVAYMAYIIGLFQQKRLRECVYFAGRAANEEKAGRKRWTANKTQMKSHLKIGKEGKSRGKKRKGGLLIITRRPAVWAMCFLYTKRVRARPTQSNYTRIHQNNRPTRCAHIVDLVAKHLSSPVSNDFDL